MNGYCHNLIVASLRNTARHFGAGTQTEVPVSLQNGRTGYLDLVVKTSLVLLAIEVELTPDRASNDPLKASALPADVLWIVVPETRVARRIIARLGFVCRRGRVHGLPVVVLTFGQARSRLARFLQPQPINSGVPPYA